MSKEIQRIISKYVNLLYLIYYRLACRQRGIILSNKSKISSDDVFEGNNYVGKYTHILSSHIGYSTYILEKCWFKNVLIGKYCSIASDVKMVSGRDHPVREFVSTSPVFHLKKAYVKTYVEENCYEPYEKCKDNSQYDAIVGNDVWIGTRVLLMGNIRIGDGAIIGAGAIVNKDVPPYAIVAGVPAKIIGYRFNDMQIKELTDIKWWEKSEEWIKKWADQFTDIDQFLKCVESEK